MEHRWLKWLLVGLATAGSLAAIGFVLYMVAIVFGMLTCLGSFAFVYDANFNKPQQTAENFVDSLVAQDFDTAFSLQKSIYSFEDRDKFTAYIEDNGLNHIVSRGEIESTNNNRLDQFAVMLTLDDGTSRRLWVRTSFSGERHYIQRYGIDDP